MKISVVIPTLNEEKNISRCLQSLLEMTFPLDEWEVFVVDNGSRDKTKEIAESFADKMSVQVLCVPEVTIGALRNAGAARARGDIFAFLDADCSVAADWALKACLRLDGAIAVTGSNYSLPPNASWIARAWDVTINKKRQAGWKEFLPSGNLFVKRSAFEKVGGFDESLMTNEDYDLCFRLRQVGYGVFCDPGVIAIHWGTPSELRGFFTKHRWHGTSVMRVFLKDTKKRKNIRAVAYAIYFFLGCVALLLSILGSVYWRTAWPGIITLFSFMTLPVILTLRVLSCRKWSTILFFELLFLHLVYGLARATSLLGKNVWPGLYRRSG